MKSFLEVSIVLSIFLFIRKKRIQQDSIFTFYNVSIIHLNGILIDSQDTDSFVKQIITLLNNVELRKSLENQALKTVEKYDWNQVGKLYLNIYESVLDKSK